MENFAQQCLDMAQSILGHNLSSISEQGTISPLANEPSRLDEPGHAALAIGEYHRATGDTSAEQHTGSGVGSVCRMGRRHAAAEQLSSMGSVHQATIPQPV